MFSSKVGVVALLVLAAGLASAQSLSLLGAGPAGPSGGGGSSNTHVVQEIDSTSSNCKQTGTSGNYSCTFPLAITTGNTLIFVEFLFSATPGTSVVPTVTGATFAKDCSPRASGQGGIDSYSAPITSGGATVITIKPPASSGVASGALFEVAGLVSSSPFDACTGATANANTSTTIWDSGAPLVAAQTDFAIGAAYNRAAASSTYTSLGNWATGGDAPQSSDGDEGYVQLINNGTQSQFTALGNSGTARTHWSAVFLYKSAVAGTAPTLQPTLLTDFSGGTNGSNVTAALMNSSAFGGNGTYVLSFTPSATLTFDNSLEPTNSTTLGVNGLSKPMSAATLSLKTDLSQLSNTDQTVQYNFDPTSSCGTKVSFGFYFESAGISTTPGNGWNSFGMFATSAGTDRIVININTGSPPTTNLETLNGDSSTLNIANNTLYWVTGLWNSSVPLSTLAYYNGTTFAQVGSNMTHASVAGNSVGHLNIGQVGTEGTATGGSAWRHSKVLIDCTGTFPLLPHT